MPNGTYGGVRGRKTKEIGGKLRKSFVFLLLDCCARAPLRQQLTSSRTPLALLAPAPPIVICVIAAR